MGDKGYSRRATETACAGVERSAFSMGARAGALVRRRRVHVFGEAGREGPEDIMDGNIVPERELVRQHLQGWEVAATGRGAHKAEVAHCSRGQRSLCASERAILQRAGADWRAGGRGGRGCGRAGGQDDRVRGRVAGWRAGGQAGGRRGGRARAFAGGLAGVPVLWAGGRVVVYMPVEYGGLQRAAS